MTMKPRPMFTGRGAVAGLALAGLAYERAAFARRQSAADALLREHTALRDVAALVARGHELQALCERVAQSAAGLVDGEVGLVLRFEGRRGILVGRWVRSLRDFPQVGQEMPFEPDSAIGQVLAWRRTARVAPGTPSRFRNDLGERAASPIELDGRLWGAIAVAGTRARPLPVRGEARLESFAELVALAIGNAEARAQLIAQATTDPLTAVANRRAFDVRLTSECLRAQRYERPLSLAIFDVDRFKSINDSVGHLAGDEVLTEVARRLSLTLRPDALLARLGGDEFAAILPECEASTARGVVQRAVREVSARAIGHVSRVTVSSGVADLAQSGVGPDELYERADMDLYGAKQRHRRAALTAVPGSHAA
jgi:diguanylate cyclase (GGDEF)-like protein